MSDPVRVLHVDDDPDFATLAGRLLEREDERFAVEAATSASQGLDRLAEGAFDCVVCDYDMPDMDGIEFLEAVREERPDLPFILFTGKGSEEIASDAISAGVTDYLQKGASSEQYAVLANRIGNAVERHRSEQALEASRDRMEFALETTDSIVFEVDLDTGVETRHGPFERLYGVDAGAVTSHEAFLDTCVHPEDRDRVEQLQRPENLPADDIAEVEFRTHPDHGEVTWIYSEMYVGTGPEGTPRRLVGIDTDVTERKRREREREQIIERVTDAIVEVNEDWEFTLVNEQAEALYDMDEAALLGREFWSVFEAARDTRFEEEYRRVMETREPTGFVEYYAGLDGWFDIEVYPKDDGGIAFYFIEVTDHYERARELERYETIVENLPVGVFRTTPDGEIVSANPALVELAGAGSEAELEGLDAGELWAEEDERAALLEDLEAGDVVREREIEFETLDGESRWMEVTLALSEADGERYLDGILRDVTDRRRRDRQLQQAETLFEHTQDALFLIDVDGKRFTVDRVNPAYEDTTGIAAADIVGRMPREILGEEYGSEVEARYRECVERREPLKYEEELPIGDDHTYWETRIAPVVTDGEVRKLVGATRDVTDRREREAELERKNEQLEQFASIVSHDLRNPLNVAMGHLELAREGDDEHLAAVARAHDRMERLIADLLALAREGAVVDELSPVDLAELAGSCWRNVETGSATLRIETDRTVRADEGRLAQLLENLLGNAVEHGGEDVTVTVGDLEGGFYVADDGPGIPSGEREDVFEPGYSTAADGTGFGLAIVRGVAGAHGWAVTVAESADGGARFEITGVE